MPKTLAERRKDSENALRDQIDREYRILAEKERIINKIINASNFEEFHSYFNLLISEGYFKL